MEVNGNDLMRLATCSERYKVKAFSLWLSSLLDANITSEAGKRLQLKLSKIKTGQS